MSIKRRLIMKMKTPSGLVWFDMALSGKKTKSEATKLPGEVV